MMQVVYMVNPINLASLKFSGHFLVLKAYLVEEIHKSDLKNIIYNNKQDKNEYFLSCSVDIKTIHLGGLIG